MRDCNNTHARVFSGYIYVCMCIYTYIVSVCRLVISDFVTPWTVACQVLLHMEFSRQEYWSRLSFPSPRDVLLHPRTETWSPILQADSLPSEPPVSKVIKAPCPGERVRLLWTSDPPRTPFPWALCPHPRLLYLLVLLAPSVCTQKHPAVSHLVLSVIIALAP